MLALTPEKILEKILATQAYMYLEGEKLCSSFKATKCIEQQKQASQPEISHSLSGRLYLSKSGWLLLSVPSALVRGTFDALDEHGLELPRLSDGTFTPHISVMSPDEMKSLSIDSEKISERGHSFNYNLGAVHVVKPKSLNGISKVWYIKVISPDLEALRKSYGLSPRPRDNKFDFHISLATKRVNVLRHNDVSKQAAEDSRPYRERADIYPMRRGRVFSAVNPHEANEVFMFGGGVDPGEEPEDASIRELEEETGYKAHNPRRMDIPPLAIDYPSDISKATDEQKERYAKYKGTRTHFVQADLKDEPPGEASEPSSYLPHAKLRWPSSLVKILSNKPRNPFEDKHLEVFKYLLNQRRNNKVIK